MSRSIPFDPNTLPLQQRVAYYAARAAKHQLQATKYPFSEGVMRRAFLPVQVYPQTADDYYVSHHRTETDDKGNVTKVPVHKVKPLRNPNRATANRNAPRHIKKSAKRVRTYERVLAQAT
jgi:hypothetical protein